jgi:hypothetical protein
MLRCAFMLMLVLASAAGAEELAPRTRALLHEALEARLTLPTEAPSLQRPLLPASVSGTSAAAARESTAAATQAAQTAAANHAAQDLANGNGNGNGKGKGDGDPSDAARNVAGQARAAEARENGGSGATHGNPHGGPPGQNNPGGNGNGNGKGNGKH